MAGEHFLLDAIAGWRALKPATKNLVLDDPQGMHLRSVDVAGALIDPVGSFGGLERPTGIAVDAEGYVYASDPDEHRILRFDPCKEVWEPLPGLGGKGIESRQFNTPRGIAISSEGDMYVADSGNNRIQVFNLKGLVLRAIWGRVKQCKRKRDVRSEPECSPAILPRVGPACGTGPGEFNQPWDLAIDSEGNLYIADKGNGRIQKWERCTNRFYIFDGTALQAHFFLVLYGDFEQDLFAYIPARGCLKRWKAGSQKCTEKIRIEKPITNVAEARLAILDVLNAVGATDLLREWCGEYPHKKDKPFVAPTHLAIDGEDRLYVMDDKKDYIEVLDTRGRVQRHITSPEALAEMFNPVETIEAQGLDLNANTEHEDTSLEICGEYHSQALDSDIEKCQWHRIVLDFGADIPTGTSVTVLTYTSEEKHSDNELADLPADRWRGAVPNGADLLVQSTPARYLWIRIQFKGNGKDTPVLQRVKVFFPRESSLRYLPAIYQQDEVSRSLLDRFLSIFDTMFGKATDELRDFVRYLDVDGVHEDFLNWLGGWIAISFEGKWTPEQKRELLRQAPELFRKRGTVAGLKDYLRIYTGCEVHILEHFALRRWLFMNADGTLGHSSTLWGHGIVERLQLGENSRIGDFRLIGVGDPERDPFHVFAHKFSVFIPATCIRTEVEEHTVQRLIEQEKPAHTQAFICKLEPRLRVGVQSTVGIDTMVGGYPCLVLGKVSTLGWDALLGSAPEQRGPAMIQVEHTRVGVNTVVG